MSEKRFAKFIDEVVLAATERLSDEGLGPREGFERLDPIVEAAVKVKPASLPADTERAAAEFVSYIFGGDVPEWLQTMS